MTDLETLSNEILLQLKDESKKYKRLKICKYLFEISKVAILSIATGLSFIYIFPILSIILIPVIDTTKHTANIDQRIFMTKLKKDLLKESLNYKSSTFKNLSEEEINQLYTLRYALSLTIFKFFICSELLLNKMSKIEPFLCVVSCMHCTIPLSVKPFKNILSSVEVPVPLTQLICGRLKSPTMMNFLTDFLRESILKAFSISYALRVPNVPTL